MENKRFPVLLRIWDKSVVGVENPSDWYLCYCATCKIVSCPAVTLGTSVGDYCWCNLLGDFICAMNGLGWVKGTCMDGRNFDTSCIGGGGGGADVIMWGVRVEHTWKLCCKNLWRVLHALQTTDL